MRHAAKLLLLVIASATFALAGQKPQSPQFIPVEVPGATATFVYGINNAGAVVGYYTGTSSSGFVYQNGVFTPLNVPGSGGTVPTAINNLGQVVGYYSDASGTHGFKYSNGTFTTIDYPGAQNTYLWGINDNGDISGATVGPQSGEASSGQGVEIR